MTDNWWDTKFGGTRGTDTDEKGQQYQYYQWTGNLGLLWPGDIRAIDRHYTVRLRDHGLIKDKIVSTGTVETSSRKLETELASAFDFGLYSHKDLEFRGSSFTVSGSNQTGYVYVKDNITGSSYLTANKITGNDQTAPSSYSFFPKEIPLPHPAVFRATINGTPTSTSIQYASDTGEGSPGLAFGKQLYNTTWENPRTIQSVDKSTNTITTVASTDNWKSGDEIIDDYCQARAQELLSSSGPTEFPSYPNYDGKSFPEQPTSIIVDFTASPVSFSGDTIFSEKTTTRIHGTTTFSGKTTINGDMVVDGTATFLNQVIVNGRLYVTGTLTTQNITTDNGTTGSGGKIVVSGNVTINGPVTSYSNNPLFIITTLGDFSLRNNPAIGASFYGLVYTAGKNTNIVGSITMNGGLLVINGLDPNRPYLSGSSITYQDFKSLLTDVGFTNNRDFVRPLLWRDTTE